MLQRNRLLIAGLVVPPLERTIVGTIDNRRDRDHPVGCKCMPSDARGTRWQCSPCLRLHADSYHPDNIEIRHVETVAGRHKRGLAQCDVDSCGRCQENRRHRLRAVTDSSSVH